MHMVIDKVVIMTLVFDPHIFNNSPRSDLEAPSSQIYPYVMSHVCIPLVYLYASHLQEKLIGQIVQVAGRLIHREPP